jgi:hypothetical protein
MPDEPTTDVTIEQFVPNPTTVLERGNVKRAPDFRSIYANNTSFNTSAFDFIMTFGEISESEEGKLSVEQKVRVIMSPLHAKIFAAIVTNNVRNFEARFGEIKIPIPPDTADEAKSHSDESAMPEG